MSKHAQFTKEDITYHELGYGICVPAVNVKLYASLADGFRMFANYEPGADPRFTEEWACAHLSDDAIADYWEFACSIGWEDATELAREIWGDDMCTDRNGAHRYRVNVYSEGRSGGWAYVDGIDNDVDGWDAIALSRWARFVRGARDIVGCVPALAVNLIYINQFEEWARGAGSLGVVSSYRKETDGS